MTFAQVTYSTKVCVYLVSRKIPFKLKVVSAWKTTQSLFFQEPVGKLVFVMQQVALKALDEFGEDDQPRSLEKLRDILDSLVTRYAQCDLIHFELVWKRGCFVFITVNNVISFWHISKIYKIN